MSQIASRHREGVGMGYSRTHVKEALLQARRDGKPTEGLRADDRETVIALERWNYLPIDQDAVDQRIADWYAANGLAVRPAGDKPSDTPSDTPGDTRDLVAGDGEGSAPASVAIEAAEAALMAATAALRLARAMAS